MPMVRSGKVTHGTREASRLITVGFCAELQGLASVAVVLLPHPVKCFFDVEAGTFFFQVPLISLNNGLGQEVR